MKKVCIIATLVAAAAMLVGCAVAERDITEVGSQFQEGIQGRGRIVDMNPTQDDFGPEFR